MNLPVSQTCKSPLSVSLHPGQHFFNYVGNISCLPGFNHYKAELKAGADQGFLERGSYVQSCVCVGEGGGRSADFISFFLNIP